jgi:hypothetical protein
MQRDKRQKKRRIRRQRYATYDDWTAGQAVPSGCLNSQATKAMPQSAPTSCATMKPGRSIGRMPEKVFVNERAMATAGFANEVEAVNQ